MADDSTSMTQSGLGFRKRWVRLCLTCWVAFELGASSARGQDVPAPTKERWLLLPVFAGRLPAHVSVDHLSNALESELRNTQHEVLGNKEAAQHFEAIHSSEPVELNNDDMTRLLQSVGQAARHLALGEMPEAQQAMEGVYALSGPARDYLNREAERARKIFDTCLMTAYLWERDHQRAQALRQMLECSRSFPGFRPEGRAYPPELREVFALAKQQLNQSPATTLSIHSTKSCGVRLNGIDVGKSPMTFSDVRSGVTRVQLECQPRVAGRIHTVELRSGTNRLDIDPVFDAAVHTSAALWLSYADEAQRAKRMRADAALIARALQVTHLVTLIVEGESNPEVRVRVESPNPREVETLSFSTTSGYSPPAVSAAVASLRATAGHSPAAAPTESMPIELDSPEPVVPVQAPPPQPRARPKPRVIHEQELVAGLALAVTGTAGFATSWVLYAQRQKFRKIGVGPDPSLDAFRSFDRRGTVVLAVGALSGLVFGLSDYFWLPDARAIPAGAWVAGGIGGVVALTGLGFALSGTHCGLRVKGEDFRSVCSRFTVDAVFGPLVAMHALPLVGIPISYAIRRWLRPNGVDVTVDVAANSGAGQLLVRGAF